MIYSRQFLGVMMRKLIVRVNVTVRHVGVETTFPPVES